MIGYLREYLHCGPPPEGLGAHLEDRKLPSLTSFRVRIAILGQKYAKPGTSLDSQTDCSL